MEVIHSLSQGGDRSRNAIRRNGGLEVWQRGTSFAVAASTQVSIADGWMVAAAAAENHTASRVAGLTNQSQWALKVQRDAGQTGVASSFIEFPLDTDEIFPLLGQFLRLSFVAKAGANYSHAGSAFGAQIYVSTGPPARAYLMSPAPTAVMNAGVTLTTSPARFEAVTPAIVPITSRAVSIRFYWIPVGTAGADDSFTIDDVQLEVVDGPSQMASPFERMQFDDELLLCLRHFYKTFNYDDAPAAGIQTGYYRHMSGAAGAVGSAGRPMCTFRFPVPLRKVPIIQFYNTVTAYPTVGWDQVRNANVNLNHTATTEVVSTVGMRIGSTGVASGLDGHILYVQFTADAGI